MSTTDQPQPLYGIAAESADGGIRMASLDLHPSAAAASKAASALLLRNPGLLRTPGTASFLVTVTPAEMDAWDVPDEDPAGGTSND